jgi:hypothetical protein
VADATVHGFAVASGWAAGSFALGALVGGVFINANPSRERQAEAVEAGTAIE